METRAMRRRRAAGVGGASVGERRWNVAMLLQEIGWASHLEGKPMEAIDNLRTSLGLFGGVLRDVTPQNVLVEARYRLAEVEFTLGNLVKASEMLTTTLAMCDELGLGDDDALFASCMDCAFLMGDIYKLQFKTDEAKDMYRWCIRHGNTSERDVLRCDQRMASADIASERFIDARNRLNDVRSKQNKLFMGTEHLDYAETCNDLGELLRITGNYTESMEWLDMAYEIRRNKLGEDHYITGETRLRIANLLIARDEFAQAEAILEQVSATTDAQVGLFSHKRVPILFSLGRAKFGQGKLEEARSHAKSALSLAKLEFGEDNAQVFAIATFEAEIHSASPEIQDATNYLMEAIRRGSSARPMGMGVTGAELARVSSLLSIRMGKTEGALQHLVLCRRILLRNFSADHPSVASVLYKMGVLKASAGDFRAAEIDLVEALRVNRLVFGQDHPRVADVLLEMARVRAQI